MAEALALAANGSQVGSFALSAGTAVRRAISSKNPTTKEWTVADSAMGEISGTLSALVTLKKYTHSAPEVNVKWLQFQREFIRLNKKFEESLSKRGFFILRPYKTRQTKKLTQKMEDLKLAIHSASCTAESQYHCVAQTVEKNMVEELNTEMLVLFQQKDPSVSTGQFVNEVVKSAATAVLPSEIVEVYLTLFTSSLSSVACAAPLQATSSSGSNVNLASSPIQAEPTTPTNHRAPVTNPFADATDQIPLRRMSIQVSA